MSKEITLATLTGKSVGCRLSTGTYLTGCLLKTGSAWRIAETEPSGEELRTPIRYRAILQPGDTVFELITLSLFQIYDLNQVYFRETKGGGRFGELFRELGLVIEDSKYMENDGYAWKLSQEAEELLTKPYLGGYPDHRASRSRVRC